MGIYDVAGGQVLAKPVTAYYEGKALRAAAARDDAYTRRLTMESDAAEAQMKSGKESPETTKARVEAAKSGMEYLVENEAKILSGYDAKIDAGVDEGEAKAWANGEFQRRRQAAKALGIFDAVGLDPGDDDGMEWDREAAIGAITTGTEALKRLNPDAQSPEGKVAADVKRGVLTPEQGAAALKGEPSSDLERIRDDPELMHIWQQMHPNKPDKPDVDKVKTTITDEQGKVHILYESGRSEVTDIKEAPKAAQTFLTPAQRAKVDKRVREANLAIEMAPAVYRGFKHSVGVVNNAVAGASAAAGQLPGQSEKPIGEDVIKARTDLRNFNEQVLTPLIKSTAQGTREQERLLKLQTQAGAWFTNPAQARVAMKQLMEWVEKTRDSDADAINIPEDGRPRFNPDAQDAREAKVRAILERQQKAREGL